MLLRSMRIVAIRAGLILGVGFAAIGVAGAQHAPGIEPSIIRFLNRLRSNPASFVAVLQQRRAYYHGNLLAIPGQPKLLTREGVCPP
jgi:hypothetical protein